jgi:hypothetical protein
MNKDIKKLIQKNTDHIQVFFRVNNKEIFCDKKLKKMIYELNKNGYITSMSCIGSKKYNPMLSFSGKSINSININKFGDVILFFKHNK